MEVLQAGLGLILGGSAIYTLCDAGEPSNHSAALSRGNDSTVIQRAPVGIWWSELLKT